MYVYKIRVKKNRNFFEIPAALFFYLANKNSEKNGIGGQRSKFLFLI